MVDATTKAKWAWFCYKMDKKVWFIVAAAAVLAFVVGILIGAFAIGGAGSSEEESMKEELKMGNRESR